MLKNFLKENKISLSKLTKSPQMIPPPSDLRNDYYQIDWKQKPMSEPIIAAARSPNYKRRKIFDRITSPPSKLTAEFGQSSNFSAVQSYQIPLQGQSQVSKKKVKTNKQNGLCLSRGVSKELQKEINRKNGRVVQQKKWFGVRQSNEHQQCSQIERQRVKRVEELKTYNERLKEQISERGRYRQIQDSLIIKDPCLEVFSFQNDKSLMASDKCSLAYSSSKLSNNSQSMKWDIVQSKWPLHS